MSDEFEPAGAVAPTRGEPGLGRLTTHDEQHAEALEHITSLAVKRGVEQVRCRINWVGGEPTILSVTFVTEHIDGEPVALPESVEEFSLNGATIRTSEDVRLGRLRDELGEIHRRGMLR